MVTVDHRPLAGPAVVGMPARPANPARPIWMFARDVCALARPQFWPVSLLPYYTGFLLATHRLVPTADQLPRLLIGGLVAGPLVWLAVLAINDAYDLPGDLRNPRKAGTPLTTGRLTPQLVRRIAAISAAIAVAVASTVGLYFAVGTLIALTLGWAYSAPPIRLKTRPGADVAANALALGALGPMSGWAALGSPAGFPWVMCVQGTLVGVALYIPTTLADYRADVASGFDTIAVRLGLRRAYVVGYAAWVAAAACCVVLAATDTMIPRHMLGFEAVIVPGLVAAYHLLLGRTQTFARITAVAFLFLIPSGVFALTYTGVLG
ncbi:MAG TPA: UbiA family prenyltransferase [Jatrophihabitantaceae bacterium]